MDEITKQAMEEILRETKRGSERANTMGPTGWLKPKVAPTNKRFLRQTLLNGNSHNLHMDKGRKERSSLHSDKLSHGRGALNSSQADSRRRMFKTDSDVHQIGSNDKRQSNHHRSEHVSRIEDRTRDTVNKYNRNEIVEHIRPSRSVIKTTEHSTSLGSQVYISSSDDDTVCSASGIMYEYTTKCRGDDRSHRRYIEKHKGKDRKEKGNHSSDEDNIRISSERLNVESSQYSSSLKEGRALEKSSHIPKVKSKHRRRETDSSSEDEQSFRTSKHKKKSHKHKKHKKNYD